MLPWHQVTMSGLALSSPHVIRCHQSHAASHLTRGRESLKWNSVWNENMIPANNGRQSGCLGFESPWSWCGQYDNTRHGHSITRRYQSEQRSQAQTQCQESYSYSHSRPIASHHQLIQIVPRPRPSLRLDIESGYVIKWSKSFRKSWLGRCELEMFLEKNLLS